VTGLAVTAGAAAVLFTATWLVGLAVGRWNVVDTIWGLSFLAVAAAAFGWWATPGVGGRQILELVLVAVWGVRLSAYVGSRSRGKGEDPRYADLLAKSRAVGSPALRALLIVFGIQAVVAWLISLPVQVVMTERQTLAVPEVWAGVVLWTVGLFFEAVGDAQMAAFRRDPANKGQVMDRGLWRYTRHPNYFGDACVWVGLWLVSADSWHGLVTVFSPALMYWFLSFKTGKPLLEQRMAETKPGYAEYMARTSGFLPLPPRSSGGRAASPAGADA
jgi:steroid 5-alpha reductase family enzyme